MEMWWSCVQQNDTLNLIHHHTGISKRALKKMPACSIEEMLAATLAMVEIENAPQG